MEERAAATLRAANRFAGGRMSSPDGGVMLRILVLLVAVAMGCGVAASLTVAHAPSHASIVERGY